MFEPLVDKASILRMSRGQIFEESGNPRELPYSIEFLVSYPKKFKSKGSTALTRNYNAIFQGQLPQTKKGPGSFNSIGKMFIKEARMVLVKSLTPSHHR